MLGSVSTDAALRRRARPPRPELDRARARAPPSSVAMSKTSNQPICRPEDLALSSPWPLAIVIPKRSRSVPTTILRVDPVRRANCRDDCRALLVRREELEAHRLRALAAGAAEPDMAVVARLEALLEQQAERDVEPGDERHRRRERRVELATCALRVRAQSK